MSDNGPPGNSFDNWALPPQPPAWPSMPPATPPKRRPRALGLGATIAATILIGAIGGVAIAFLTRAHTDSPSGGGGAPTALPTNAPPSPALSLYQKSLATMRAAAGFHYVNTSNGPDPETITGDAGASGGRQDITFTASYGVEKFTLLLVSGTVYFEGNTAAVEDQLGVLKADAATLQNKWVSVVAGNGPYSILQPGITVADQVAEVQFVPVSTTQVTTSGGTRATRILGNIPASQNAPAETAQMDVAPTSNIPVDYSTSVTVSGSAITSTTTFSEWGTAPTVTAPPGAVAWSSLATAAPPGGYGSGGTGATSPTPSATPAPAI
ncbi:MAG TPA: hypothetical protein VI434_00475 [Candidatus Dormibacteraeota bacterium]